MRARSKLLLGSLTLVGVAGVVTLPPARVRLAPERPLPTTELPRVVAGAYHVHTVRSDGSGTVEQVAAAAAGAGLSFVIFTDHGDGMRASDPPAYHSGVLCIDAVEISTDHGHYVALDLLPAPYPLAGEARDVVEDVSRLGGFGVIAHPASPKPELAWSDWSVAPQAIEWLNGDTEWRDESFLALGGALLHYWLRPAETLGSMLDRQAATFDRWTELSRRQPVVALAAADAHAAVSVAIGAQPVTLARVPSYQTVFESQSIRVDLAEPWIGDPARDAEALMGALRQGRVYSVVDALATPGALAFSATSGRNAAVMGERLEPEGAVELAAYAEGPEDAELVLVRDGEVLRIAPMPELRYTAGPEAAVYRVEVLLPRAPGRPAVPWIVGNPITVGAVAEPVPPPQTEPAQTLTLFEDAETAAGWTVEHEVHSLAAVESTESVEGRELALRYALYSDPTGNPFAALVRGVEDLGPYDRLSFRARADRPHRLSVQLRRRTDDASAQWHWRRSVYVGPDPREVTLPFDEFRLVGEAEADEARTPAPELTNATTLLFVVDLVNTLPGSAGVVWVDDVRLEAGG